MADFHQIEQKWQARWQRDQTFKTRPINPEQNKYYVLDMFPYPSGDGLHVGHVEGYTGTDISARYRRMKGDNVLHPMGWDAFGLPAEQYAINHGVHPRVTTDRNTKRFKEQLQRLGFSYDWSREIDTTDPKYYRWTQWIFLTLFEKGLAYTADIPVNWCEALGTVLANEEVIDGKSERGGHPVVRRPMRQWVLKITAYAERLLADLDNLDWPESIKEQQRNWIGKSQGANIHFSVSGTREKFTVFTTRPDTLMGCTYCVLAPEHPLVERITTPEQLSAVRTYQQAAASRSDLERTALAKDKTGVFTGGFAIHPVTQKSVPIWISDYVLATYGTGAVMAVPAHDERDFQFATKFGLPMLRVVDGGELPWVQDGVCVNSQFLDGLATPDAKRAMIDWLASHQAGEEKVTYKLRDWIFSRQRYWGEPIPILIDQSGALTGVSAEDLPVTLPSVDRYQPTGTGESPLAAIKEWTDVQLGGKSYRRETNTMPQWAGSCWYYLRFIDPSNDKEAWSREAEKYWMPVDLYVGGAEHAVLHLLYARFWHKVLFDCGLVSTSEPFQRLFNQGMILGPDGERMSKSRGNVINPDDVVAQYGADTLRLFEMFLGPLDKNKPWNTSSIEGVSRFLKRVWTAATADAAGLNPEVQDVPLSDDQAKLLHRTIAKVDNDSQHLQFNTAISQMMIFMNEFIHWNPKPKEALEKFVLCLAPYAPHLAEEIWERLGHQESLAWHPFPSFDPKWLVDDTFVLVIQVNGKIRDKLVAPKGISQEAALALAKSSAKVQNEIGEKPLLKVVLVKDKLLSLVT